jgi:hypothetical protein
VLDELRVVDALLASPRESALPENFTFATMAEIGSLPRPHASPAPVFAYLVSYLVAAWLLTGAGFMLAGSAMRALGETALDVGAQFAHIFGAVGRAGADVVRDFGSLPAFLGAAVALDVVLVLAMIVGVSVVRPRLAERLRS